jgi:hypothetical protein
MEYPQVVDEIEGQMWRVVANMLKRDGSSSSWGLGSRLTTHQRKEPNMLLNNF